MTTGGASTRRSGAVASRARGPGRHGVRPVVSSMRTASPYASQGYQEAIEALYAAAYQIKFVVKARGPELDFVVPPLEGP
jgi:hypothetical protein